MNDVLYFFSNVIWYFSAFSLLENFLSNVSEKKYSTVLFWYKGIFFFGISIFIAFLGIQYELQGILYLVLCFLYAYVFFWSARKYHLAGALGFGLCSVFLHYIFQFISGYWFLNGQSSWSKSELLSFPIAATCFVVGMFILYRIIWGIYQYHKGWEPNAAGVMNLAVIVLFSGLFLNLIRQIKKNSALYEENEVLILLLLTGLVVMNAYCLSYGDYMNRNIRLRYQLEQEEKKNFVEFEYYKTIEKNYSDCRQVLHDVKNHVQILEALYREGQVTAGDEYASAFVDKMNEIYPKYYAERKIVNIILYDKEKKTARHNIKMKYELEDIDLGFLSDYDLSTILCNLFDNAITCCEKLPEEMRTISFKMRKVNNFLILKMENPLGLLAKTEAELKKLRYRIKKGMGIRNVKNVIKGKNGDLSIHINDNLFAVMISFDI